MVRATPTLAVLFLHALEALAAPQRGSAALSARAVPDEFEANTNIGPGGSNFVDSAHFRVYGGESAAAKSALEMLEGAFECFVTDLGWSPTGLSFNAKDDSGPYFKTPIYSVDALTGAAGVMHSDFETGQAWLEVVHEYLSVPGVTVHEWGHGLHYHQKTWVDQENTGTWWETFANWVADTYKTSDLCASARKNHGQEAMDTEIVLQKVLGDSFQVLVDGTPDSGNYYEAWPFFTYLTENPGKLEGLGKDTLRQMMVQYEAGSNEDPLHTLQRVAGTTTVAQIVGDYWAHMAYVDINHAPGQARFLAEREQINFNNVEASGNGYKVISARAPRYMGANVIPLQVSGGSVEAKVTSQGEFTATLVAFNTETKAARYVTLKEGAGSIKVESGEEASLVVAHTPSKLITYNGFKIGEDVNKGLDYSFTLTGASA